MSEIRKRLFVLFSALFFFFALFALPVFANNNADTSESTLSVSPSTIPADGSTTATISIQVKDGSGNTLSGDHVTLTSTTDSGLVINSEAMGSTSSTAATDSNGNVTFTVKSSNPSPGTDTFTAADVSDSPAVPLGSNNSVSVNFTASALAPSSSCSDQTPGTPVITSAVASGSNQIILTWTDASDPVSSYFLSYGVATGQYIYGNPNVGPQGTTSYTVGNLATGTTYYLALKAVNGCAPGSYSNEISAAAGGVVTPAPADTANSTSQIDTTPSDTPAPSDTPTPTPTDTPAPAKTAESSKTNTLIYVILFVLVFGGVCVFVSWKYQNRKQKHEDTAENNGNQQEKNLPQEKLN